MGMKPCYLILAGALALGASACANDGRPPHREAVTVPASNSNMRPYLGKKEADAGRAAERRGLKWRVVERDGEAFMITKDYRLDRVNFKVRNGKVFEAYRG